MKVSCCNALIESGTCTYACVCVYPPAVHDAVHGAVSSAHPWLNGLVGRIGGVVFFAPFPAFRHVHLLHHKHTNDPKKVWTLVMSLLSPSPRPHHLSVSALPPVMDACPCFVTVTVVVVAVLVGADRIPTTGVAAAQPC